MKKDDGVLAVISGFSGAGKGTLMKALLDRYPNYTLSVSCTTRDPRPGEENGKEYYFVSVEDFELLIEEDQLLEHACYCGNYYGTPRRYVEEAMAEGKDVLLEIEIQGALQIKKKFPQALLIFVMPPDVEELKRRLSGRGTESSEVMEARLRRAAEEAEGMEDYDFLLINDRIDECVETLHGIIQSQHHRMSRHRSKIEEVKRDLENIL